jgi:hypothetical protein
MQRRAKKFLDPTARRVWELVENIRNVFGDRYGDMAADIALSITEPLCRQNKALSAFKAEQMLQEPSGLQVTMPFYVSR